MGNYIKRYDAMKLCQKWSKICFDTNDSKGQWAADSIEEELVEIPKANVEEITYGEWIDKYNNKFTNHFYICSICGEKALNNFKLNALENWVTVQALSSRCPHCGAHMVNADN